MSNNLNSSVNIANHTTKRARKSSSSFGGQNIEVDEVKINEISNSYQAPTEVEEVAVTNIENNIDIQKELEEEYKETLKSIGLENEDIDKIMSGEITLEELFQEIDSNPEYADKRRNILEASYMQNYKELLKENGYNYEFNNLTELKATIDKLKAEQKNSSEKKQSKEKATLSKIINELKQSKHLNDIDAYQEYIKQYGKTEKIKKLEESLDEGRLLGVFGNGWNLNEKQQELLKEINGYSEENNEFLAEINELEYIYNETKTEIDNYMNNVDKYAHEKDYDKNTKFNKDSLATTILLKNNYQKVMEQNQYNPNMAGASTTSTNININNKEDLVAILSCIINDEAGFESGKSTGIYDFTSGDTILRHYKDWQEYMNDEEKETFNYLYNTKGTDVAYNYLKNDLADVLDKRWLDGEKEKNQSEAINSKVEKSVESVFVTPVEGIVAAYHSVEAKIKGEELKRSDVYSKGDVWRSAIAADIAEEHPNLSFLYSTGMSIADSALLIGANVATGGAASGILSASLMGSRAYVSTLNDGLDRGLSDGDAIMLATTSAILESAMENYSLGHLTNLEGKLSENVVKNTEKIVANVKNPQVANAMSKMYYSLATAASQAFCEGEEEFGTEIANYIADALISGDLSNYSTSVENYLQQGYTEEEAVVKTSFDLLGQALEAGLGGMISGTFYGGISGIKSTHRASQKAANEIYQNVNTNKAESFANIVATEYAIKEAEERAIKEDKSLKLKNMKENIRDMFQDQNKQQEFTFAYDLQFFATPSESSSFLNKLRNIFKNNTSQISENEASTTNNSTITNENSTKNNQQNLTRNLERNYAKNSEVTSSKIETTRQHGSVVCEEQILDDTAVNEKGQEIIKRMQEFDLNEFYHYEIPEGQIRDENGAFYGKGAVAVITKNQAIKMENAPIPGVKLSGEHGENVRDIYSAIYDSDFYGIPWQWDVTSDGNIAIQFCDDSPSIIWLTEMNSFQFEQLKNLNEEIKEIYNNDKEYFDNKPMEFAVSIGNNSDIECANSLDPVIERITELYPKLANTSTIETSPNSIESTNTIEKSDIKVDTKLKQLVNSATEKEDINTFIETLNKIKAINDENVPDGYATAAEYKRAFAREYIDSGKMDAIDNNNFILQQIVDPVMFEEFVGTERLNEVFTKNLKEHPKVFCDNVFANATIESFNELMNEPTMKDYINNLTTTELAGILKEFKSGQKCSWLDSSTFVDKVCSLDTNEFYSLLDNIGYYNEEMTDYINSSKDKTELLKLLDNINNKYITEESFFEDIDRNRIISNFIELSEYSNENVQKYIDEINNTRKAINSKIKGSFSEIDGLMGLLATPGKYSTGKVAYIPNSESKYYTFSYEIDGKKHIVDIDKDFDGTVDLTLYLKDKNISQAILNSKIEMSIIPNVIKENLVIDENMGAKRGLNEITFEVDGQEYKKIVDLSSISSSELYNEFKNAKSANIKSVNPLGTFNDNTSRENGIYKLKYKVDGQEHETFITTTKNALGESIIDVDKFVRENNIFNVSDVVVEDINDETIKTKLKDKFKNIDNEDLFNNQIYGGNQSDVSYMIQDLFTNKDKLQGISLKKAELLNSLIDKKFDNLSDTEKIQLAEHYAACGCNYMAIANAFVTYMNNIQNGNTIFKDKFGYNLYENKENGTKSYNIEAIAFDMYLRYAKNSGMEVSSFVKEEAGISSEKFESIVIDYFKENGINATTSVEYIDTNLFHYPSIKNKLQNDILKSEGFHILDAKGFDLELFLDEKDNAGLTDTALKNVTTDGKVLKNIGSHAMLITDIDENGDLIVSSWSYKYKFLSDNMQQAYDNKNLANDPRASITSINFSIPESETISNQQKNRLAYDLQFFSNQNIPERVQDVKNSVFESKNGMAIGKNNPISLSTNENSIYRVVGNSQIEDIVETGYVRSNKKYQGTKKEGRIWWTKGSDKLYYYDKRPVLEVNGKNLQDGQVGAVSIDDLSAVWIFDEKQNKYVNKIDIIREKYENTKYIQEITPEILEDILINQIYELEENGGSKEKKEKLEIKYNNVAKSEISREILQYEINKLALIANGEIAKEDVRRLELQTKGKLTESEKTELEKIGELSKEKISELEKKIETVSKDERSTYLKSLNAKIDTTDENKQLAKQLSTEINQKASQSESKVTKDLQSLEKNNVTLIGEKYKLKEQDSLEEKILRDAAEDGKIDEKTIRLKASKIKDSLRYTFLIQDDIYTENFYNIKNQLEEMGYRVTRIKNAWSKKKYKGVNIVLRDENNQPIEVQFHTKDSFATKETLTHDIYEIERNEGLKNINNKLSEKATEIQEKLQSTVDTPKDALDIEEFDEEK